ncbi:condensation domain-containing protein [Goodfellowiella coeruleoviolacea]|uniref:Phosphopantetheine attachment site n=1 Tax=Goodfellowiella coeruleoviolacea TaxID=334858 RepID=A0AAE3GGG7_9PSEU|nr:condensation domain-containing protein [Goodfellowiella coeruleoviolacea]MCP2166905.1 Phosphopantetheine attachment site [Goodfellowiella coeruleoviolacea]
MTEDLYVLPASFGQKRLWLLEQVQPDTPLYTMAAALHLRGPLDTEALNRALTAVVERHEVLRTVLRLAGGDVVQVVRAPAPVALEVSTVDGDVAAAVARAEELAAIPFDLAEGPLLRCHLLRLSAREHVLLNVVHHTVADGWSMGVLLNELITRYADPAAELPELTVQYADYSVWQQEQLDSGELNDQVEYWRTELDGVQALRLPADHTTRATSGAHTVPVRVPAAVVRQFRLVGPNGVTAAMVAMAAYATMLSRWSRQTDLVVGIPVAGRSEVELEPLVGFFVNTLPIRLDLSDNPTFLDLLTQVRDRCLRAYANADVPFELLVEELKPERRAGRLPLVQTMLAINNTSLPSATGIQGLTIEPLPLSTATAQFDISADLAEDQDALTGTLTLAADLFTADSATLAAKSLTTILRTAVASPSTRLTDLPCPIADARPLADAPLPQDPASPPAAEAGDPSPRTPVELLLTRLWSEILEVDTVNVHQEFYASGGNSLRAVRVVMRAREMGVELPVDLVLGEHTIRQLARGQLGGTPAAARSQAPGEDAAPGLLV